MRPNKVETPVQYFCMSCVSVRRIFWSWYFNSQCNSSTKKKLLWGHILPYPKDGLVQPKHILRASSFVEDNFSFLTRHLTDCKPRTASTSSVWLPYSANTVTFTYHPLFELFFHWCYLKTTTKKYIYIFITDKHLFVQSYIRYSYLSQMIYTQSFCSN